MTDRPVKEEALARIDSERDTWRALVEEVGPDRMDEPGPMGEWSFKDLAAHVLVWRRRTVARLEAAGGGPPAPERSWPAGVGEDDDSVNAWIYSQHHDRPAADVLRDVDDSYARMRAAVARLDEDVIVTPGRLPWLGGASLAEAGRTSHFLDEHEPSVREWLATRDR
jgi:hypothetical protein